MIRDKRFKVTLTVVFVLMTILCCSLMFTTFAFADYQDIVDDQSAIVNFNQLANYYDFSTNYYNFSSITSNGYVTITLPNQSVWWARLPFGTSIGDVSTHYLYIRQDNNKSYDLSLYYDSSTNPRDLGDLSNNNSMILYGHTDYGFSFHNASASTFPIDLRLIVIDVTMMFGSGNEPNLQECNDLFVSDYYAYSTGTAMSLSGLNTYSEGYFDALELTHLVYSGQLFANSVFANIGGVYPHTNNYIELFNRGVNDVSMGFSFPSELLAGDTIVIDLDRIEIGVTGNNNSPHNTPVYIGYYDNGAFVSLAAFNSDTMTYSSGYAYEDKYFMVYTNAHIVINLPKNLNTLYFNASACDVFFNTFKIEVKSVNLATTIQDSYNKGYAKAQDYYGINGAGGQIIYNQGVAAGIQQANDYTFGSLMFSVINAPVQAVLNIFNFEFLGYNIKNFITVVLTLCLILCIVNLFIGGK